MSSSLATPKGLWMKSGFLAVKLAVLALVRGRCSARLCHAGGFALGLSVLGCGGASSGSAEHGLLVIAVDALRRDHLELYGSDRATMPFLARLADESLIFDDAWSTGAALQPPHVALLTGCDPLVAVSPRVPLADGSSVAPVLAWRVPQEVPHLPLEFLASGWATGGFFDHGGLSELSGFGFGFHDFVVSGDSSATRDTGVRHVGPRVLDWLDDIGNRNWFGYVHLNDLERMWTRGVDNLPIDFEPRPEIDYLVPQANSEPIFHAVPLSRKSEFQRSLAEFEAIYDTALLELDRGLEALYRGLEERDMLDRTTVVIIGTYGFGFGEAGLMVDAGTLSEVDLRVPLLLRPAPMLGLATGRREPALVSLIDVAPTLLDLAGIERPAGMHGRSWSRLLAGRTDRVREYAFALGGFHTGFAVVDDEYLFTHSMPGEGSPRLAESWFGTRDPEHPIVEGLFARGERLRPGARLEGIADPVRGDRLRAAGESWFRSVGRVRDALHLHRWLPSVRDPEVLEELRAMGLLGEL